MALVAVAFLIPAPTMAKTTVTRFTASKELVRTGVNSLPAVTVLSHGLLKVTVSFARAGTLSAGAKGVTGTTRVLGACAVGPCNDSFRGASTAALVVRHYAVWLELSLTQPRTATGTAFGFAVELAVETSAGWFVVTGYFSSGTTAARTAQTVHVNLLVDLGTTTLPTVRVVDATLAACASTTRCP